MPFLTVRVRSMILGMAPIQNEQEVTERTEEDASPNSGEFGYGKQRLGRSLAISGLLCRGGGHGGEEGGAEVEAVLHGGPAVEFSAEANALFHEHDGDLGLL